MTLHLRFWGTRGSIPAPGPDTIRYGGNTPCLEIRTPEGGLLILDAGTGIRALGRTLDAGTAVRGDIFITHAHWDHIQGLPFFAPAFQAGNRFAIWSSAPINGQLEQAVRTQMSGAMFPVDFDALGATIDFREVPAEGASGLGWRLTALPVRHPGGAVGFRVEGAAPRGETAGAVVYVSDNELGAGGTYDVPGDWRARFVAFARGARVLVHDAMYTAEEYARHPGWGHSSMEDVVALALEAGVEQLLLFHHAPERGDAEIDRHVARCRAVVEGGGGALQIAAAAEGMTLTV